MPNTMQKSSIPPSTLLVYNFQKEKNRRDTEKKDSCPYCRKRGEFCPEWIKNVIPGEESFKKLKAAEVVIWLRHTRHLD